MVRFVTEPEEPRAKPLVVTLEPCNDGSVDVKVDDWYVARFREDGALGLYDLGGCPSGLTVDKSDHIKVVKE